MIKKPLQTLPTNIPNQGDVVLIRDQISKHQAREPYIYCYSNSLLVTKI